MNSTKDEINVPIALSAFRDGGCEQTRSASFYRSSDWGFLILGGAEILRYPGTSDSLTAIRGNFGHRISAPATMDTQYLCEWTLVCFELAFLNVTLAY